MKIKFIGHSYHKSTNSSKFFTKILEGLGAVDYGWDESWLAGGKEPDLGDLSLYELIVIWQLPHIAKKIPKSLRSRCVYAPMHDAVAGLDGKFWRSLRGMRVICFSVHDHVKALRNRVESIHWHYYPDTPPAYQAASLDQLRLFFWQRRPYPNWRTLCGKIPMTQFASVHLHVAPDPGLGEFLSPIESEVRTYNITKSNWFESSSDYTRKLAENNVFVCPRELEGIGMALLEAQGAGMICIANNAPTMNEYIVDGINGYLIDKSDDSESIEIIDPEQTSYFSKHYFKKGSLNSQKRIPEINAYLRKSSEPPFTNIISPALQVAKGLLRGNRAELRLLDSLATSSRSGKAGREAPIVSIVTVTRNNATGLTRTLRSVFEQTYPYFEYIVVDGQSTDETLGLLKRYGEGIDKWTSEPDAGPYDAMNRALELCRGRFVIFMNSGDEFNDRHALEFAMQEAPLDADILCGHHFYVKAAHKLQARASRDLHSTYRELVTGHFSMRWLSGIPCHQSTLTSVELLKSRPYDWKRFRIAADHDFLFDAMAGGAKAYNTNTFIAKYYRGGISSKQTKICNQNWREIALKHCKSESAVSRFYGNL